MLVLLLLGEIPAVGALYKGLGLDIFAGVPFFSGFTLRSTLLLCHVGIGCAGLGFLLTAKVTEYTSAPRLRSFTLSSLFWQRRWQ